ncbi:PRA1 family protein 3-like [Onthophagus taurus]|uniref:PRA1 family protein 3-like n=1 Tax=Onthophagus taurus TaxID=166361 RepID=UPI000C20E92B|nr:PRA1 family protein 3-like [Onthophagus taurus]XP_022915425.1 PRA1 family protein 3-like [Onthophagus taurus]
MFKPTKDNGMEFAPLRTLGDFVLESARFQLPNFKDLDKWGYRVTNNLLYYQSNYFLMSLLVFAIIGALHPVKMVYGLATITILILIFWYTTNENPMASDFKKNHPIVSILFVLGGIYLVMNMLDSIVVFFIGILFPFSAIFIHSSLRLRSVKNKLVNQAENYKLTQTPMGFFLKELGLRTDVF